jgi:hypothetical protein
MAQDGEYGHMSVIEGGEKVDSKMISNYTKHMI